MANARLYDLFMAPLERAGLRRARRHLVSRVRGRALELGAGTGLLFPSYDAPPAVAIDVDHEALRRARERDPRVPLVRADNEALPFREGTFDSVVESLSLCSVRNPAAALAEAHRVLKPGGELHLLEHVRPPGAILGALFDLVSPLWLLLSGGCHLDRHTAALVAPAGFTTLDQTVRLRGILCRVRARR